jgi:hypothetical protein
MLAGSTSCPSGLRFPRETQYGLSLPIGPVLLLLQNLLLVRFVDSDAAAAPVPFLVADENVLFGIFNADDLPLLLLLANGCKDGAMSALESVVLALDIPVPFSPPESSCCWVVPPRASLMRRKLCRLWSDSNVSWGLIRWRSSSMLRCRGMPIDEVEATPYATTPPVEECGMAGPTRGRRPRPSELITRYVEYFLGNKIRRVSTSVLQEEVNADDMLHEKV